MKRKLKFNKCIQPLLVFISVIVAVPALQANDQAQRYRGEYTYSHDVNTFCPAINSQCYWLDPASNSEIQQQLKALADNATREPYKSICILVQGKIIRETGSDTFAADYDGLINISKYFGLCAQTDLVTQGDLQHHRWVLASINGDKLAFAQQGNTIPALDFGEKMSVSINMGCNASTGQAVLRENAIIFQISQSSKSACSAKQLKQERLLKNVLSSEPVITINGDKNLFLQSHDTLLKYLPRDWVH